MSEENFYTQTIEKDQDSPLESNKTTETNQVNEEPKIFELSTEKTNDNNEPAETNESIAEDSNSENNTIKDIEKDEFVMEENNQPMPTVSMPVYKPHEESKFKNFLKTAFSLSYLPVVLCAIATFFMVFSRLFQTILYSNGSNGVQNAYLAFNFIGFICIAASLIIYVINACLKKKLNLDQHCLSFLFVFSHLFKK